MTIKTILAQDTVGSNANSIPNGTLAAGYSTGSAGVAWTAADFASHYLPYPAIRIDQDPAASDATADVLDVEGGAATVNDVPGWVERARRQYALKVRGWQRWPAVYCSASSIAPVVSALQAAKLTDVPMWLALPGESVAQASARVTGATGPFPCIGVQYAQNTTAGTDLDVFSVPWVTAVAGAAAPPRANAAPGGQWPGGAVMTGIGTDGKLWQTYYNYATNTWSKPNRL